MAGIGQESCEVSNSDRAEYQLSCAATADRIMINWALRVSKHLVFLLFGVSLAVAQDGSFADTLFPLLERAECRACHSSDGVASGTRLQFPEPGTSVARLESFGKSLVVLVDRSRPEESLLLKKPTNRIPHSGGVRIQPGSQDESVLLGWARKLAALSGDELAKALKYRDEELSGAGHKRVQVTVRRLTHSQYNNTVRDLLGDQTRPPTSFRPRISSTVSRISIRRRASRRC